MARASSRSEVVAGCAGRVVRGQGGGAVPQHARGDRPASAGGRARARGDRAAPGSTVRERAIRGGTDGSRLSFMGLPTPNIFAGEQNFHSRLEWVSVAGHGEGGGRDRLARAGLGGKDLIAGLAGQIEDIASASNLRVLTGEQPFVLAMHQRR